MAQIWKAVMGSSSDLVLSGSIYNPTYNSVVFVDFGKVVPATNIETLNLNWTEKDLPERLRTKHVHRLHPYMGKFIPQLVEIFLRKYVDFEREVLIGKEFWEVIGNDPNTYSEVLEIYRKVGREKGPEMIEKLALDY